MVATVLDPEQAQARAIRHLAELDGQRVLEIGCGEGRLTLQLAPGTASWLATDPNAPDVEVARHKLPTSLSDSVSFAVAGGAEVDAPAYEFDLVLFSSSL